MLLSCTLALASALGRMPELRLDSHELRILHKVALEYKLSATETRLLYTIRLVENGPPGRELGVLAKPAMRLAHCPSASLRLQAQWASGTIKRRFTGDLSAFSRRWAPLRAKNDPHGLNKNWLRNARYYLGLRP